MDDERLEAMLGAAGAAARWPVTPDLRGSVARRITIPESPDLRPAVVERIGGRPDRVMGPSDGRPVRRAIRLLRPLALAAVLVVVVAGLAAGLGFRLPGFELERVERTPPAGTGLDLGSAIPLDEALAFDRPAVLLPSGLPRPDTAFLRGAGDRSIITLAWRAAPGEDRLPGSDLSLSLMAVPGDVNESLVRKMLGPGSGIEALDVGGAPGWWITGAPHEILIMEPDSSVGTLRAAIAGDTLVFARDGTLYRLESSLGRDRTLEIARTLR